MVESLTDKIHKMPKLAFLHPYRGGEFYYERDCYDELYHLIAKAVNGDTADTRDALERGEECVTLTGTPGIGKSVFYAYFFERYRREHPNAWIIAVAFQDQKVKEFSVAAVGKEPEYYGSAIATEDLLRKATLEAVKWTEANEGEVAQTDKKLLFLCDGPPDKIRRQSVVFTSLNEKWRKISRKLFFDFYLPLWTLTELRGAAEVLGYPLSKEVIGQRFDKFGGVARECLALNTEILEVAERELMLEIERISDSNKLRNVLLEKKDGAICHRVLHYVPERNRKLKSTHLASKFATERLRERMLSKPYEQIEDLRATVGRLRGVELLREWVYELARGKALLMQE